MDESGKSGWSTGNRDPLPVAVPFDNLTDGPFAPSVFRDYHTGDTPVNDQLQVGACRSLADGRLTTTPGVLNVDGKQKLFTSPETVPLWSTPSVTAEARLLVLWANGAAATLNKADFYDYEFIPIGNIALYPDWKRTLTVGGVSVTRLYFPLGWITVAQKTVKDRSVTPATTKDVFRVTQIKWPCQNWILQGGGSTTVPVLVTSFVGYNRYLVTVYGNGLYTDAGTPKASTDTGKTCWIRQIAIGAVIPNGTILGAVKVGSHYEADVSRWI